MKIETIKRMLDACYQAKRARDMLPPLPKGVLPSYIHYLDVIQSMEKKGQQVKVSDISEVLDIPRPGVTRTVKEMEEKGYLKKISSPDDGRITYVTMTEAGRALSETHNEQYFDSLAPYMDGITEEEAECMIRTTEKFYQMMCRRRDDDAKR